MKLLDKLKIKVMRRKEKEMNNETPLRIFQVKEIRKIRGITIAELAEATGMNPSHISRIERHTCNPTVYTLSKLAAALDVTLKDLFI